jgi:hypothetical protein
VQPEQHAVTFGSVPHARTVATPPGEVVERDPENEAGDETAEPAGEAGGDAQS